MGYIEGLGSEQAAAAAQAPPSPFSAGAKTMEEKFTPSQACAAFAAGLRYEDIPDKVLDLIKRDLLDWAGCAIKGSRDRSSQPIRNVKALLGGAPQAGVFGDPALTDMRTAATENGYFGHIFEMDDVDRESISHPATVVMPPALAAAQYFGRSGRDILTAIVAGFEVMLRIGAAITPAHYKIFHTTATTGVFGAAASAGRILRLPPERMLWALGNAGTLACGLWQFNPDGAMSKFIHAGGAAGNGLWVALLAQNGFSGASHILEGPQGFFAGFARQEVNMELFRDFGKRWRAGTISFKPYPCCRHTHSAIDAALEIRRQLLEKPGDRIARLTAHTYGTALSIAGKTRPKTGRDAKFSLSYCIVSSILRGSPAEASFSQQATEDPELRALLERITVIDDPKLDACVPHNWPSRIEAVTESGRELTAQVQAPKGDPENEISWAECETKFRTMTLDILTGKQQDAVIAYAKEFDGVADFSRENLFRLANS